jgi:alpha-1,2-mannosyltransferase
MGRDYRISGPQNLFMTLLLPRRKFYLVSYLLAMTFCNLFMAGDVVSRLRNGYQDFTIYYTGALLLRHGEASKLYGLATQYQTQLTFTSVPIRQGALPYNHPPFEALLFVPFTLLGYWPAYLLWTALSLVMVGLSIWLLRKQFPQLAAVSPLILGLGASAFFPVVLGIIHGQDEVFLEFLLVLAFICLDRGNDAAAGAFLAAGLFRPHLAVPLAVLLAVRRWRIVLGFAPVAFVLAGISVLLTGWRGQIDYVRFVFLVERSRIGSYGPPAIPNIRGLILGWQGLSVPSPFMGFVVFVTSAVVFLVALFRIRNGRDSIVFAGCLATVTTILVSFHALCYDFTLLLPLIFFLLASTASGQRREIDARTVLLLILLFLTPLYVYLLLASGKYFLVGFILLWLYVRLVLTPAPAEVPV